MRKQPIKDMAASVRQRLLNQAHAGNRPFQEIAQYYLMERFLYRLSRSPHHGRFVLKGALMLRVWQAPEARPTMDIDLLGRISNEENAIAATMREILSVPVEPDGLSFSTADLSVERIAEGAQYRGIRVRIPASLDTMRLYLLIDIGFGDAVHPPPEKKAFPTILGDLPAPVLSCYSRESTIAEKFHAMVSHGQLNSRMKDFYDIWWLSRRFDFDGAILREAIGQTMERREMPFPDRITAFSEQFAQTHQAQWTAFSKRIVSADAPRPFIAVVSSIAAFLDPVVTAYAKKESFESRWTAPGPWESR